MSWGRRTSGEEEVGIQALLDEALYGSAKSAPLKPLNLEMRSQRDFGAPEPLPPPQSLQGSPVCPAPSPGRSDDQSPGTDRSDFRSSGRPPFGPPRQKPLEPVEVQIHGMEPAHSIRRPALAAFLVVVLIGLGLLSFTPPQQSVPEPFLENVSRLHAQGDYRAALDEYTRLRQSPQAQTGVDPACLAFLEAGAAESLWKQGIETSKNFELALRSYEEAIQADRTPMRVYGSEALMAKAEMNVAKALASQPNDVTAALIARQSLETLVDSPEYNTSPAVVLGLAQRRLAELIRVENPEKAIALLTRSKDQKGEYSEGLEDLLIARIYRDILRDDDRAYEFFSLVKNNPLASETNRKTAEEALAVINGTGLHTPETLDPENLENLPQLKAE